MKQKIFDEFKFYDYPYWQNHEKSRLRIYFAGEGTEDAMVLSNGLYQYDELLSDIQKFAQDHTADMLMDRELKWFVELMIDCDKSGGCINSARSIAKSVKV